MPESMSSGILAVTLTQKQIGFGALTILDSASDLKLQRELLTVNFGGNSSFVMYSAKLIISGIATHQGHLVPGKNLNYQPPKGFYGWELTVNTGSIYGFDQYFSQEEKPKEETKVISNEPTFGLAFERVQDALEGAIRFLEPKSITMAEAIRNRARLYRVSGNEIYFITSEWLKARFEKPQPRSAIHEAFAVVLGMAVSIHFVDEDSVSLVPEYADPIDKDSEALVRIAEELGGKVVQ